METTAVIGVLAATFTTIANIPQAYNIIRDQTTKHISALTYCILFTGTSLWVWYGLLNQDWPVIVTNSITALTTLVILGLKFAPQAVVGQIHRKVMPERTKKEAIKRAKK